MKLTCAKAGTAEARVGAQEREFVLAADVLTTDVARKYNSNFIAMTKVPSCAELRLRTNLKYYNSPVQFSFKIFTQAAK